MNPFSLRKGALALAALTALLAQSAAAQSYVMRVYQPGVRPAIAPRLVLPASVDFGNVAAGYDEQRSVRLENSGNGDLAITSIALSPSSTDYSVLHDCTTLAPGAACHAYVTFSPSASASRSGTLTVTSNDELGPHHVALSGTGQAGQLAVSQETVAFGARPVGSVTPGTVILSNTGTVATGLWFSSLAAPFSVTSTTCADTLAPGANCSFTVSYAPQSAGTYSRVFTVSGSAGVAPRSVAYSGSTASATLAVSVTSQAFGNVALGTSASHTLTVSNTSSLSTSLSFSGLSAPYSRNGGTCGATLGAGANCTYIVQYAPTSAGSTSPVLTVAGDSGVASHNVAYSGTGATAVLATSVSSYNFGNVNGGSTATHSLTVTNNGTVSTTLAHAIAAPFSRNGGTCGATLAPAASCTLVIQYAPTADGSHAQTLTLTGSTGVASRTVSYSGSGTYPIVAVVSSRNNATFIKRSDGSWYGTGHNGWGELGLGDTTRRLSFTKIPAIQGATTVVASSNNTFARMPDGTWKSTGYNLGALGLGSTVAQSTFQTVTSLGTDTTTVIPGSYGTFARRANGTWLASGANQYGQLGFGDTAQRTTFQAVTALASATDIVNLEGEATYARFSDGSWKVAGRNLEGQLGLVDTTNRTTFVANSAIAGATQVVAGRYGSVYARLSNGSWMATGSNGSGELGLGDTANRTSFTAVAALNGASSVLPGASVTYAKLSNGAWAAAGSLRWTAQSSRIVFSAVTELAGRTQVMAAKSAVVTQLADGAWAAAGFNGNGELGMGDTSDRSALTEFPGQ